MYQSLLQLQPQQHCIAHDIPLRLAAPEAKADDARDRRPLLLLLAQRVVGMSEATRSSSRP